MRVKFCNFLLAILGLGLCFQPIYGKGGRGGGGGSRGGGGWGSRSSSSGGWGSRSSSSSSSGGSSSSSSSHSSSRYSPSSSRYSPSSSRSSPSSSRYSSSSSGYSPPSSSRYSPSSNSRHSPFSSSGYSPSSSSRYLPDVSWPEYSAALREMERTKDYDKFLQRIRSMTEAKTGRNPSPKLNTPIRSFSPPPFSSKDAKLTPPPSTFFSRQPAYNPNYREPHAAVDSKQNILPSAPIAQAPSSSYQPGQNSGHSDLSSLYPRQFGNSYNQPNFPSINQQHGHSLFQHQPGFIQSHSSLSQSANVKPNPVQPGMSRPYVTPQGIPRPYPVQPGFPSMVQPGQMKPYPVQPNFQSSQPLGANVWHARSGVPAPVYMNYGGLPTGTNMHVKTHKKKGLLGALLTEGVPQHKMEKVKYYASYPHPYGMRGVAKTRSLNGINTFIGNHGNPATMYTIFPYMSNKHARKLFKPRLGYRPFFHRHHHHYYYHTHGIGEDFDIDNSHYDVLKSDKYVGQCHRPLRPKNSTIECNSTISEVTCRISCSTGFGFPDNSTKKENKCWHVTGVWRPIKNFPECEPICNHTCLNGGKCIGPGMCGCKSDYRGPRCEYHFLKCDVRKLITGSMTSWACTHMKNGTSCKVKCKSPAEFAIASSANEYLCTPDGKWTPDFIPECVVKETTTEDTKENATIHDVEAKETSTNIQNQLFV